MLLKKVLAGLAVVGSLAFWTQTAQAALICSACNYLAPATYLGQHDSTTFDVSTFQHAFIGTPSGTNFSDYWVFDVLPAASSTASGDFTELTLILNFSGALYADNGTICAGGPGSACGAPSLGALLASDTDPDPEQWQVAADLTPGRYIILVTGTTNDTGNSTYTGQVSFLPTNRFLVPEPGTLALLGLGLIGWAGTAYRRLNRS